MADLSPRIDSRTRRQTLRFLVSGLAATGADFATYMGMVHLLFEGGGPDTAKTLSYILGTTVAFLLNKFWTFESTQRSAREVISFIALYAMSWILNVGVNHVVLGVAGGAVMEIVAFVMATGCSTVTNFIGQKFWVFRDAA